NRGSSPQTGAHSKLQSRIHLTEARLRLNYQGYVLLQGRVSNGSLISWSGGAVCGRCKHSVNPLRIACLLLVENGVTMALFVVNPTPELTVGLSNGEGSWWPNWPVCDVVRCSQGSSTDFVNFRVGGNFAPTSSIALMSARRPDEFCVA
uniref:Alpha-galactosidase n=1 Tax=Mesocestoides corti TaxID=53468 RepID=A0A5K3FT20_MESCO